VRIGRRAVSSLPPVRQALAPRARRAFRDARHILFVCKGNVCRSPFAAGYARRRMPDGVVVRSAGHLPRPARGCPPLAVEAARALGVDLGLHRSVALTDAMLREADVVFVFNDDDRWLLARRYPFARAKLVPLGRLTTGGPLEIRDPHDGEAEDFARTYEVIRRALDRAIALVPTASSAA